MESFMLNQLLKNIEIDSSSSEEREFINELQSMKEFFTTGHEHREITIIQDFLSRKSTINVEEMKKKSNDLREKGNLIFRSSNGDIRHAARVYTEAIIAAPICSEALAFAHANRSLALMRLNFLESAYDDCLCALEEGYPVAMQYKIILRQAEVAKELGNLEKMKRHISELEAIKLESSELKKLESLRKSLSEMETNVTGIKEKEINMEDRNQWKSTEGPFKIVKAVGQKERSMIATKPIKKGDKIFSDRAFAFVCEKPGAQICNNCADTMIVPFPCASCSGRVVYCSLKCKQDNARVHTYECPLINCINNNMTLCFPLRMFLEGFPEILPYLNRKRDAQALWSECFKNKKIKNFKYIQILRSTSCWSISAKARGKFRVDIRSAEKLAIYLKNCTNFFYCLSDTAASSKEWKIFIGATILRHIGQVHIFRHTKDDINIKLNSLSPRVERGQLFKTYYSSCEVYKFFPTLFICNHECAPTFETRFDGRYMKAVAFRDVKVGDEINGSYTWQLGIQIFSKEDRQNKHMANFYFTCQCGECQGSDENFKEYHQFWCENSNCKKSYSAESISAMDGGLRCPFCGKQQEFNFGKEMVSIERMVHDVQDRAELFNRFDQIQRKLKDHNVAKFAIILHLMEWCLKSHFGPMVMQEYSCVIIFSEQQPLTSSELDKLYEITMSMLEYPIEMVMKRDQFVSLFWDVIALRGKKIRVKDLGNSLKIVNEFHIQRRTVLMNYYEDFILPLIE